MTRLSDQIAAGNTSTEVVEAVAVAIAETYHKGPVDDAYMKTACSGSQWFYEAAEAAITALLRALGEYG